MKQTSSDKKKASSPVEPVIISRLQRATAAQIARERARALWRQRASRILLGAVVTAVGLRVLTIAAQPGMAAYRSERKTALLRAQLHREAERRQHLKDEISFLQSDHGVEEEARQLGWTRVGEVSLQIITPEPKPAAKSGSTSPAASTSGKIPTQISGSERLRLALTRWLQRRK